MFTRLFGNTNVSRRVNGSIEENGVGKFNSIDLTALRRIKKLGCTHVWFTGVIRHGTVTDYTQYGIPNNHPAIIKGKAGSPYAIVDYYDVDPDMATDVTKRMNEYEQLVARAHKAGLKVIMDFVPNHVAREYHSICCPQDVRDLGADDNTDWHFSVNNNFYYCWGQELKPQFDTSHDSDGNPIAPYTEQPAKATGNDVFSAQPGKNDWYETVKLNYGIDYCDAGGRSEHFSDSEGNVPDTWYKMTQILMFWASKGVDGFRCDMAEMVPAAFWHYATAEVRAIYPWITFIGEVYDPNQYRNYINAGFNYLYDKVGMYDTVRAITCGKCSTQEITRQWQATDDIRDNMLYFLENHDEQRIASDFFAGSAEKGIPALIVSALLRHNPFMLYAGEEFGEKGMEAEGFSGCDGRTTIFDYWCVDTLRKGYYARKELSKEEKAIEKVHSQVLNIATTEDAVSNGKFFDLMYVNPHLHQQYAFMRGHGNEILIIVANFSDKNEVVDINIPQAALDYLEIASNKYKAKDLLSKKDISLYIANNSNLKINVPANNGVVLKVIL